MKVSNQSKVNTLAAQLRRHDKSLTLSDAFRQAWSIIKTNENAQLLIFTKTDGTIARRIVDINWRLYYAPKGSTKKVKEGLKLFADLARVATKPSYPIISTYRSNIQLLAA